MQRPALRTPSARPPPPSADSDRRVAACGMSSRRRLTWACVTTRAAPTCTRATRRSAASMRLITSGAASPWT
eukprot:4208220-Prymnesium_polylepis.1